MRHLVACVAMFGAGCSVITSLDGWSFEQRDAGPVDGLDAGGERDSGEAPTDGGSDGGACPEACTGTTPFCDPAMGRCVECRSASDCGPAPAVTCADARHIRTSEPVCDAGSCGYATTDMRCPGGCESNACQVDVWVPLPSSPLSATHDGFTVVWTGTEMIVWGGGRAEAGLGARYNPATDTWSPVSTDGAPSPRRNHSAVWTGTEMIIWGGLSPSDMLVYDSGRYNPTTDTWATPSSSGAPEARWDHDAVWTGTEMIVWGGLEQRPGEAGDQADGFARYNPATDAWAPVATTGAPEWFPAVWTESGMLVWSCSDALSAIYDPASNAWESLSSGPDMGTMNVYEDSTARVWTGSELLRWGGVDVLANVYDTGVRFRLSVGTTTAIPTAGAPSPRAHPSAVWTGSEMVVFGGHDATGLLGDGGCYNPTTNMWRPLPSEWAPSARREHEAIWTGVEMIVWGPSDSGARYVPER